MSIYSIFIDETGSFYKSTSKDTNFVGGWITKDFSKNKTIKKINPVIEEINKKIIEKYSDEKLFYLEKDLHYSSLFHDSRRQEQDSHIEVPFEYVPEIIQGITNVLKDEALYIFRSSGFPTYFINEQAAYFEILHSTIFQILDNSIFNNEDVDKIEIIIASRRSKRVVGKNIYDSIEEYEHKIKVNLEQQINNIFKFKSFNKKVDVKIKSANQDFGLQIADIFTGCLRDGEYIDLYKDKKKYNIHNAFKHSAKRKCQEIRDIFSFDKSQGLILAFEYLSSQDISKEDDLELKNIINDFLSKLDKSDLPDFYEELKNYLELKTRKDLLKYENLDFVECYIKNVESRLDYISNKEYYRNKIDFILLKNYLKIHSHKGKTGLIEVNRMQEVLDDINSGIFSNIYELFQEKLEFTLSVATILFNNLNFAGWDDKLTDQLKKYKANLRENDILAEHIKKDRNLARLTGSLGQIYGLLFDLDKDETYYSLAEEYFKEDIYYCIKDSDDYNKGLGYLTTLYFKNGYLDKAINTFLKETNSEEQEIYFIYDLNRNKSFNFNEKSPFLKLHRLYICALAQKNNDQEILGIDKLRNEFLKFDKVNSYPNFLVAKWIGVITANQGNLTDALEIFQLIEKSPSKEDFIIKVIRLSLKLLLHYTKRLLNQESILDLEKSIDDLEKENQGIKQKLKNLGLYKYLDKEPELSDLYEIANLMPFYYS